MGMSGNLAAVDSGTLNRLKGDSGAMERFILTAIESQHQSMMDRMKNEMGFTEEQMAAAMGPTQAFLMEAMADSAQARPGPLPLEGGASNIIGLEKAWHGLHYLLTGEVAGGEGPVADAVLGGHEFGEDLGYGPPRFLTPDQVRATSAALQALDEDALRARFDPETMDEEIYPNGIWVEEGEEALEWLLETFEEVKHFYQGAAERGEAVVLWIG